MEIKTILVPYDFSEHSTQALIWALGFAEHWGAKVALFNVVSLFTRAPDPDGMFVLDFLGSKPRWWPGRSINSAISPLPRRVLQ